jgi:hypothetical protein
MYVIISPVLESYCRGEGLGGGGGLLHVCYYIFDKGG